MTTRQQLYKQNYSQKTYFTVDGNYHFDYLCTINSTQDANMIINLKKETQEVREWFREAQAATGLSGRALVIGAIMDFRQKAKDRTTQPRKKNSEPKKPAA